MALKSIISKAGFLQPGLLYRYLIVTVAVIAAVPITFVLDFCTFT
jgi:hypothetical protein